MMGSARCFFGEEVADMDEYPCKSKSPAYSGSDDNRDSANPVYSDPIDIRDFCDMNRFEKMMKDWATGTGLATVAVGKDGKYISGSYNFTEFCRDLTRKSPEGLRRCIECDRKGAGIYLCHAGLVDFAAPITLDDGTLLGSIIGGQVLPEQPDEAKFRETAKELGIEENTYLKALRKVNIRSREEIRASADLLANVINMFVRTSYAARKSAASLTERAGIISSLSKIYFCDYYIDIDKDTYLELNADADAGLQKYTKNRGRASELLEFAYQCFAEGEYREGFRTFTDLITLKSRLVKRQSAVFEFCCADPGWCRASFIVVKRDKEGLASHVIFAIQNIQEEKEQEIKNRLVLKEAADKANRASQAKTDFLSRMSHDMRTPLNGIIGMTYLASQEDNSEKVADYLKKVDISSKFLLGLINDILDMTKAESNKIELHPEPYTSQEFRSYLDSVFQPLCQEKNQKFVVDMHSAEDRIPVLDKLRFNQVVFNLLSNAVKYTPEGGTIIFRMDFRQLERSERLGMDMEVTDTGIGISPRFQKLLFDPFTQEKRSDIDSNRGSGLGLAIAKRMVSMMDGTISVKSEIGKGTTFFIKMECGSVPEEQGTHTGEDSREAFDFRGIHVLLCEDHPLNQEIAKVLLERKGAVVETADNGQTGVEKFSESPLDFYDMILMDIRMPVLDGRAAAAKIRTLSRKDAGSVPIIAMTADAFADDVRRCFDAGMNGHIAKPIDPEQLYRKLKYFLK